VNVVYTVEVPEQFTEIKFSPHDISFLAQNIIFLRYVEIDGELRKVLTVIKMRRSAHSTAMYEYEITGQGMRILQPLRDFRGILTGTPVRRSQADHGTPAGLTEVEAKLLLKLIQLGQATAAALTVELGLGEKDVQAALQRLVQLNHVLRSGEAAMAVFRPLSRPLGSP
jgi:circadian clock protein KaiC